jgi:ribosomal protein L11 methyltransferase
MTAEWIEVDIEASVDAGELLSRLEDPHVAGAWERESGVRLYWPVDRWNGDVLGRLESVLITPDGTRPRVHVQSVPAQDWNAAWARSVVPIRIGRRVLVRPSWEPAAAEPDDIEVVLDPKQAFGTGHHATTQLLIEWLEERIRGSERVLDVGTGSGLLAMVALRLGAQSALGLDSDPVAIECANDYAAANGFGEELTLRVGDLSSLQALSVSRFDVILANLDRRTLLDAVEPLAPFLRHGAVLLVSGLLKEDRDEVARAYAAIGASARQVRARDGWIAMELLRADSCEGTD